jgi:hypothetical protein
MDGRAREVSGPLRMAELVQFLTKIAEALEPLE